MNNLKNINYTNQFGGNNNIKLENIDIGVWNEEPKELYVIGDLHGDFFVMKQALELSGCVEFQETILENFMDENLNLIDGCNVYSANEFDFNKKKFIKWNPKKENCFIVLAGDIIDRCRNVNRSKSECHNVVIDENCDYLMLKLIFDLDNQAQKFNSRIILILGNHEIMNIQDITSYVSIKGNQDKNRLKNIKILLKENINRIYGIIRINSYVIAHGGVNGDFFEDFNKENINNYIDYSDKIEKIIQYNILLRKYIKNLYEKINKNKIEDIENNFISNSKSPFWDRTNGLKMKKLDCDVIFNDNILKIPKEILDKLKIIVAHCPQTDLNINLIPCYRNDDKKNIWRIDIAMSKAWNEYDLEYIKEIFKNNLKDMNDIKLYKNIINDDEMNNVKILKITKNKEEIILSEENTINYFYDTIFKHNKLKKYYFIFSDIEKYMNNIHIKNHLLKEIKQIKNELYNLIKN
jgi:hypothetical protein